ncbi:class F sortase [Pseudonocardia sp. CA-142604]|uniref:class F sortase n=1 Tax=Pseudonocardia sp. CA-142604 TaxID=3240024 RepID=UPI003D8FE0BD
MRDEPAAAGGHRSRTGRLLLVLAVVLALAAAGSLALAIGDGPRTPHRAVTVIAPPAAPAGGVVPDTALGPSAPVSLDVPAIGVHSSLLRLGLNPDGTVEVPPLDSREAGWYENSPTPGEQGPAVILGHVDSARTGPGVFYDLRTMLPGDGITVGRADGTTVAFRVDQVATYPKNVFPTAAVYGDIDHAGLRLITCGGRFDKAARSYEDNIVVYASALSAGQTG